MGVEVWGGRGGRGCTLQSLLGTSSHPGAFVFNQPVVLRQCSHPHCAPAPSSIGFVGS